VQDERCFDMQLDPAWTDGFEDMDHDRHEPTFESSEVQLVIARSGEDLTWLDALPQIPAVVYNRGGKDSLLPTNRSNLVIIKQENRGREDEVMLNHIVEHYDNLPDATVFLQGWPFGHCPGLIKSVRRVVAAMTDARKMAMLQGSIGTVDGMLPLSGTFWQYSMEQGKVGLAGEFEKFFHHNDHPTERARALYNKTCTALLGGAPCPRFQWTAEGSQWAVSRDRIRFTPKHVYEGALRLGEGWEGKYRGLVLEALWPTMWGAASWEPKDIEHVNLTGYAYGRGRARHDYCATDEGRRTLMFSCSERIEFCERQRLENKTKSKLFELRRKDYQIHDESLEEPWHMMAELERVLWGAATWTSNSSGPTKLFLPRIVEQDGGLRLMQKGQIKDALKWKISKNHSRFIFARQAASGAWHYLGCEGGYARLVDKKVSWTPSWRLDGWIGLSFGKEELYLTLPQDEAQAELRCLKKKEPHDFHNFHDATFVINALPRETGSQT